MTVVVEAASRRETPLQRFFAAVAEWGMAKVVPQAQRLGQILVEVQRPGHRPTDLGHFQRMSKPDAEMIAIGRDKHLRFVPQSPESDRMYDPVPVPLESIPRAARSPVVFREGPAARLGRLRGKGLWKHHLEESFSILICDGVRVQLKPPTPSLASLLTKAWLSDFVSNGPITNRKYSFPAVT
jgi:hypothetical protein